MGNCLKSPTSDDISLLHESQSDRASYGDGTEPDQEPPPPYQEQVPVYHPTPSQTRLATQLTEEEQIRIAQRIGLIQHLPKGVYDPGRDGSEKKIRENGPISDYGYCCCVSALNSLNLKGDYLLILEHHMLSDFVDELKTSTKY
ncbi:RING finger protein 11 isoform 2-T2 [Vipera latastei]